MGHPDGVGGVDRLVELTAAVFAMNVSRGAGGTPTVETRSRVSVVATAVAYRGVAPSNFGPTLGYGAISINATSTSPGVVADSRTTSAP